MNNRIKQFRARTTLNRQMRVLLIGVAGPSLIMIMVVLIMFGMLNREYEVTLKNATTASEFNADFKDRLDLDMYYFAVWSKNMDHLPLEEVQHAQDILNRLQKTTTLKENKWRVQSMINLCARLSECMLELEGTSSYDLRMEQLDNNIYLITGLVETYMHEYIYDELHELSSLQRQISKRVNQSIVQVVLIALFLGVFLVGYAVHVGRGITRPIKDLCEKVSRLGRGDFTVQPLSVRNDEIRTLDEGFDEMAIQIQGLLEREKSNQNALRRTELELLQAQINPHFLYNTFDSIIWLAETHRDEEVVQMTTDLSNFFRHSLSKGKDIITLGVEKQQVESYLNIQKVRYCEILDYEIDIPDELLRYSIPKLTLQPLVENALYHGIKNKRGGGKITIRARQCGRDIRIQVQDNGAGMTEEQLTALRGGIYRDQHSGLGLINVHQRLKLYCGEKYGLLFDSQFGVGTTVTVCIPKQNQLLP